MLWVTGSGHPWPSWEFPSPRAWPCKGLHFHSLVPTKAQYLSLSVGVKGPSSGQEAGPGSSGGSQVSWPWALPFLSKLDLGEEGSRGA